MTTTTDVLSDQDLQFFEENGYIVVHDAVPPENVQAMVDAIYDFLEIPREPSPQWYAPPVNAGGNVEMYQHQALWNNRQHPKMHAIFSQLWGTEKLWVSLDRASFKPPPNPDYPKWQKTGFLHLDADHTKEIRFGLQGVLALTDTAADQGGFHCLPGWHKRREEFAELLGDEGAIKGERMYELDIPLTPIPMKAGDLVVWHRALPHGNGWNTSDKPRMAQYITMWRAGERYQGMMDQRIQVWREHSGPVPGLRPFPGDPRGWEREHCQTAELTPLGRKLLGVDPWD